MKKIGIICAGDRELAPFLPCLRDETVSERAMLKVREGVLAGANVAALFSGVCKVNAAVAAQVLIDHYGVQAMINAGTAGAMDERLSVFDVVIAAETAYHDVAGHILTGFHPWLEDACFRSDGELVRLTRQAVGKMERPPRAFCGRMVTGEAFIDRQGRREINEKYAPLAVDMESAAIAHVCYVNRVPFIAIRSITDTATHSGTGNFEKNCARASEIARDVTLALLKEMVNQEAGA